MDIIIAILSLVFVMLITFKIAYKKIIKNKSVLPINSHYENDLNLDDICSSKYLKLTNVNPTIKIKNSDYFYKSSLDFNQTSLSLIILKKREIILC